MKKRNDFINSVTAYLKYDWDYLYYDLLINEYILSTSAINVPYLELIHSQASAGF